MQFTEVPIKGAWLIDIQPNADERGFFARTVCVDQFSRYGLNANFVQQSISSNERKGTLRGMHYQRAPYEEEKLVRVTSGAIYDVILDLRPSAESYRKWFAVELSAENNRAIYIPKGVAHGFQTLTDFTIILYQMTTRYHPEAVAGVRWDDPVFSIQWPVDERIVAPKDMGFKFFNEGQ